MNRKGISPLIAAVLLIAFTMAVASIFAQWAPQLIQDAQQSTSQQAQNIQDCNTITMELTQVNESSVSIQQRSGTETAGNITVTWFYTDNAPVQVDATMYGTRDAIQATTNTSTGTYTLDRVEVDSLSCEGAPTATHQES